MHWSKSDIVRSDMDEVELGMEDHVRYSFDLSDRTRLVEVLGRSLTSTAAVTVATLACVTGVGAGLEAAAALRLNENLGFCTAEARSCSIDCSNPFKN